MANSSEKSTNNPDVYGQNTPLNSNPDESYFPFLKLPPELRNRIYHYVLDHGSLTVCDRRLEEFEERLRTTYDCR
ncbi:MAG: hypothetical protein M1835_001648, partial [Candelina submexicana]